MIAQLVFLLSLLAACCVYRFHFWKKI